MVYKSKMAQERSVGDSVKNKKLKKSMINNSSD